jgi:hypothetical protein
MFYKIVEIATAERVCETYVLVHFWETEQDVTRGNPPVLINDFIMGLRPTATRLKEGLEATNGVEVRPEDLETVERDVPGEMRENILAYWQRATAKGWRGDHSAAGARTTQPFSENGCVLRREGAKITEPIERDQSDPHGILERPDVQALRGQTFEECAPSQL